MSSYDAHHQIRCKALGQSRAPLGSLVLEVWSPKKGRKTNENDAHFVSHMTQIWVTWTKLDTISYCCCIDHKCLDSCKNWKGLKFTISTPILFGSKIFVFAGVVFRKPFSKKKRCSGIHGFQVSGPRYWIRNVASLEHRRLEEWMMEVVDTQNKGDTQNQ